MQTKLKQLSKSIIGTKMPKSLKNPHKPNKQASKTRAKMPAQTPNKLAKSTLKILGGIYKGRTLQMASLETTRSSKAILKESFFNTLGCGILGVNFVEFFAGSGSIGIEALSRGAKSALFFECNQAAYEILKLNLQTICQRGERYRIVLGDTFSHYPLALKGLESPSIAYIDPPFHLRQEMQDIYQKCYQMISYLDKNLFHLVVLEHISSLEIPREIGDFALVKSRKFGRSALSYFE